MQRTTLEELNQSLARASKDNRQVKRTKKFGREIKKILSHSIYVQPNLFETLLGLNIAAPPKKPNMNTHNLYTVWTRFPNATKKGLHEFKVCKKTAMAIKELLQNKPQFMFYKSDEAPFNEQSSTLTVNQIQIPISSNYARHKLCNTLFGSKKCLVTMWEYEELATKMGEYPRHESKKPRNWFKYLYPKVRHLNATILEYTDLDNLVLMDGGYVRINPLYLKLFN